MGQNGSRAAPAWNRATMPKWEYSSSSSGGPLPFHGPPEGVERARRRGSRPSEKTSFLAHPAAIIWS